MTDIFPLLDHPTTATALVLARRWFKCRSLGSGADTLIHAVDVANNLRSYIHDVDPDVVAAALLHDSPELAPSSVDLDTALAEVSPEVARLVRALQHEHTRLDTGYIPAPPEHDLHLMQLSAADKIASIQLVLGRASYASDPAAYWTSRRAFTAALPYLHAFHQATERVLPKTMATRLGHLIARAEQGAAHADDRG